MQEEMTTTSASVWHGITAGFTNLIGFIPTLLGALALLVIGWWIARAVAGLIEKVLNRLNAEAAFLRSGLGSYLPVGERGPVSITGVIGTVAKWFLFLIFVQAAANLLGMPQVTNVINSIVLFLPKLVVALLIVVAGAWAARYVSAMVEASITRSNIGRPALFGTMTRFAILGFASIAALNEIGVARNLLTILFGGLVAALSLAIGLAFGLGGQGVASEITRGWYEDNRNRLSKLKAVPNDNV